MNYNELSINSLNNMDLAGLLYNTLLQFLELGNVLFAFPSFYNFATFNSSSLILNSSSCFRNDIFTRNKPLGYC